jgi:hypothetical protein
VLLSSQLLYYLLIAQTGIVGAFDSHIHDLYTLPIGGIIGGLLAGFTKHKHIKIELCTMFVAQFILAFFYPHYSLMTMLLLGLVVGYTTPLLLFSLGKQQTINLAIGLTISYAIGTLLYTYPFEQRGIIAFVLSSISIISLRFIDISAENNVKQTNIHIGTILLFSLWIFLDSALFETLSRSYDMDIWSHYALVIIAFHTLGIIVAYRLKELNMLSKDNITISLFIVSYLLYWLKMPILLAILYPFTISWYNFILFGYIMRLNNMLYIALSMIVIGWLSTIMANGIVLEGYFWIAYAILGLSSTIFYIKNKGKT